MADLIISGGVPRARGDGVDAAARIVIERHHCKRRGEAEYDALRQSHVRNFRDDQESLLTEARERARPTVVQVPRHTKAIRPERVVDLAAIAAEMASRDHAATEAASALRYSYASGYFEWERAEYQTIRRLAEQDDSSYFARLAAEATPVEQMMRSEAVMNALTAHDDRVSAALQAIENNGASVAARVIEESGVQAAIRKIEQGNFASMLRAAEEASLPHKLTDRFDPDWLSYMRRPWEENQ
jgi:hypothetical protein